MVEDFNRARNEHRCDADLMTLRQIVVDTWERMKADLQLEAVELYSGYNPLLLIEGKYEVLNVSHFSSMECIIDEESLIWDCGDGNIIIESLNADKLEMRLNGPNIWYRELPPPLLPLPKHISCLKTTTPPPAGNSKSLTIGRLLDYY